MISAGKLLLSQCSVGAKSLHSWCRKNSWISITEDPLQIKTNTGINNVLVTVGNSQRGEKLDDIVTFCLSRKLL